ncbi:MAG: carbohydrate ABC transporter permease [Turicibacter sp.]
MANESISMRSIMKNSDFTVQQKRSILKEKFKRLLFGTREKKGALGQTIIYILLISIGFVYLYPLLYMFITSMMSLEDLLDTSTKWIPSTLYFKNYTDALMVMNYWETLVKNIIYALIPTLCQVMICSLTAYGFARFKFRGKNILMAIMLLTFIIPPQILMMPTYLLYSDLGLLGSLNAFILPALLGQGLKSAIFILIFYQFYKPIPSALIEAAQIDGANHFKIYWSIGIRCAIPAFIVVFIFSFVFYWNETYLTTLYLGNSGMGVKSNFTTLLIQLGKFEDSYKTMYPATANDANKLNEAIRFAGTMLSIAPLLFLSGILQKYFVESIDSSGITGE